MPRIPGARKQDVPEDIRRVWETQEAERGDAQPNTPIYALRPTIFRAHRALDAAIQGSGLLSAHLKNLVALRAALINGCPF